MQDIWNEKGEIFTDEKSFKVGDIIHVVFKENLVIKYKSEVKKDKKILERKRNKFILYLFLFQTEK